MTCGRIVMGLVSGMFDGRWECGLAIVIESGDLKFVRRVLPDWLRCERIGVATFICAT